MTSRLRLVLIGCSKTKLPYTYNARNGGRISCQEMYGGQLFRKRVEYAESRGLKWAVLSAEYGLWHPDVIHRPYDTTMSSLAPANRALWHLQVARRVIDELWEPFDAGDMPGPLLPRNLSVEIHAGADYAHPLAEILSMFGVIVSAPCAHLGIGQQLALYTSGELAPIPEGAGS